jgi:hypothetical protein
MTENAWCYTRGRGFVALLAGHDIRRPTTDQPRSQRLWEGIKTFGSPRFDAVTAHHRSTS